jgi:hypothetical protein
MFPFIASAALLGAFAWAGWYGMTLPIVYQSNATGNCVRVEVANGEPFDCDNLPIKYLLRTVQ